MATTTLEGNGHPPDESVASPKKVTRPSNVFPQNRLEDAVRIAATIENANAGQPYPPPDVAIALNRSPGSSAFHILLSSSLKYGLTTGSYKSEKIIVTQFGQRLTVPTTPDERRQAIIQAALTPPTFRRAYEYYKGKKLPDTQYFMNTLVREFGVHAEHCAEIFRANLHFAELLRQATTGLWVSADVTAGLAVPAGADATEIESEDEGSSGVPTPEVLEDLRLVPPASPLVPEKPQRPKAIFVGHGPNKTCLTQLTKILDEWGLPYKVAEYEPNAGRPISQKVADLMEECGAAILIFTADRELRDLDGNPVWLSAENVGNELGAASVLYNGRVVVFKESGVDLASNYSGIGYIEFEKNKLSAHAMELFREIRHFGLIKISVGE